MSDVLDECLTLLETSTRASPVPAAHAQASEPLPNSSVESDGATIEECLDGHPQHAAKLGPLLEVALEISRVVPPTSSPAAFAAGKRRMLEALA